MKLNLLVLRCTNIEISKIFYEKLKCKFQKEQHGKGSVHYATEIDGLVLELYPLNGSNVDNNRLGFSLDMDNLDEYLVSKGIEVHSRYTFNAKTAYVVQDPDGRKIELMSLKM